MFEFLIDRQVVGILTSNDQGIVGWTVESTVAASHDACVLPIVKGCPRKLSSGRYLKCLSESTFLLLVKGGAIMCGFYWDLLYKHTTIDIKLLNKSML